MELMKLVGMYSDHELTGLWREVCVHVSTERAYLLQQSCAAIDETERTFVAIYEEMRQRSLLSVNLDRRRYRTKALNPLEVAAKLAVAAWSGGEPVNHKDAAKPVVRSER